MLIKNRSEFERFLRGHRQVMRFGCLVNWPGGCGQNIFAHTQHERTQSVATCATDSRPRGWTGWHTAWLLGDRSVGCVCGYGRLTQ